MKLLIIDDDPNYGQAMTSFLLALNHEVQSIMDPKIAWKIIEEDPTQFDAILLDLIMPGMNGLELLRKIRDAGIPLPVVLVSGFADLEASAEAVHWGISGLALKPFVPGQLTRILSKVEKELGFTPPSQVKVKLENEEEDALTISQEVKVQITQLMNDTIDCWYSFSGGNKANLAERSGVWKINIDGTSLRTRTLDRYLKAETLPNRPKVKKVLDTANFVIDTSPPSSRRYRLDTKLCLLELTLDAIGFWNPRKKIKKSIIRKMRRKSAFKKEQ